MKEIQKALYNLIKKVQYNRLDLNSIYLLKHALTEKRFLTYITISKKMDENFFYTLFEADIKEKNFNIYQLLVNMSKIYFINGDMKTSIVLHKYLLNKLVKEKAPAKELILEFYNLAIKYYRDKNYISALNIISSYLTQFENTSISKHDMKTAIKSYIFYISLKTELRQDLDSLHSYGEKALTLLSTYAQDAKPKEVYSFLLQIYNQLVVVSRLNENFSQALDFEQKALKIIENPEADITNTLMYATYEQLSLTYESMNKNELATQYIEKAKASL